MRRLKPPASRSRGSRSCSARSSRPRAGPRRRSTSIPPRAARLAIVGIGEGWVAPFSRAVFEAEFARGLDIASEVVLGEILAGLGLDAPTLLARSNEPEIKERLRAATAEAEAGGIFGSPTFVTPNGELFWGDDRVEAALDAAAISVT